MSYRTIRVPTEGSLVRTGDPTVHEDPPTHTVAIASGTAFDRYTVLEPLGSGGMGEVYGAYDTKLSRRVALKVLRRSDAEFELRLMREAQALALAQLSHPNVVAVFDAGVVERRFFVAMEFIEGTTLRRWQRNASSWREVLRVYLRAGRGLAAAHAVDLVHRDFKPDNVIVATHGRVKVLDFGLARYVGDRVQAPAAAAVVGPIRAAVGSDTLAQAAPSPGLSSLSSLESPMTEVGSMLGTPGYMAPEQYESGSIDARADQFAFCAAFYEGLYRQKPLASRASKRCSPRP